LKRRRLTAASADAAAGLQAEWTEKHRIRCRIRYRIRHHIRYQIFYWRHLRSVKWWGRASVDWVSLPHPIPGSRSLFSCLYTILCRHEPLSKHVQHTFPVTLWPIIYSCVNTVLRANHLYSPILVHSCFYLRTKGVRPGTESPDCEGFTLQVQVLHMQNLPLPDRHSASRSACFMSTGWLRWYRGKGKHHGKKFRKTAPMLTRVRGGGRVVSAAGIDLMMRRTTSYVRHPRSNGQINGFARATDIPISFVIWFSWQFRSWMVLFGSLLDQFVSSFARANVLSKFEFDADWFFDFSTRILINRFNGL
jgi:hypothetical protein